MLKLRFRHSNRLFFRYYAASDRVKWGGCHTLKKPVFIFFFDIFFKNIHYIQKIFTFEEIIFSLERCIVKKKTYLCSVRLEKWLDDKKAFFALS